MIMTMDDRTLVDLIRSILASIESLKAVDDTTAKAVGDLADTVRVNLNAIFERINSMQSVINDQEQRIKELEVRNG
jgi:hypothetical protein